MEQIDVYSVVWKYLGNDFVIDVDDEEHAYRLARHIAETKERTNVRVIATTIDIDDKTLQKISERIASRIRLALGKEQMEERLHGNH